jgi:hypothetical protein
VGSLRAGALYFALVFASDRVLGRIRQFFIARPNR